MKFEHIPLREDGGGDVLITGETPAEIGELIEHFKLWPGDYMARANAVMAGKLEVRRKMKTHGAGYSRDDAWFTFSDKLDAKVTSSLWHGKSQTFLDPYKKKLAEITGYKGPIPDMDLTSKLKRSLCYTHILVACSIKDETLHYTAMSEAGTWDKYTARQHAEMLAKDSFAGDVGARYHETEYIDNGNGTYRRNPKYPSNHKAEPSLTAEWLWDTLFDWWRANHASAKQEAILVATEKLNSGPLLSPSWKLRYSGCHNLESRSPDYTLYYADITSTHDYDGKGTKFSTMKWEEFAKMAKKSYRFRVISTFHDYRVRDTFTDEEACMGDGVDTVSAPGDEDDMAMMSPGTEGFEDTWEDQLNSNPHETLEAYFPQTYAKECDGTKTSEGNDG